MGTLRRVTGGALLALALVPPAHGAGEFYLYEPKPVEKPAAPVEPDEGVLVRNITIKRGDTLYGLSRKFAGKGSYFPQILLFNEISNPNLIYAGKELKVPVTTESGLNRPADGEAKAARPHAPAAKPAAAAKRKTPARVAAPAPAPQPAAAAKKAAPARATAVTASPTKATVSAEQKLYEKAIAEYRNNQFVLAQQSFSTFLDRYPSSPLAPDAALYKADCLLKEAEGPQ